MRWWGGPPGPQPAPWPAFSNGYKFYHSEEIPAPFPLKMAQRRRGSPAEFAAGGPPAQQDDLAAQIGYFQFPETGPFIEFQQRSPTADEFTPIRVVQLRRAQGDERCHNGPQQLSTLHAGYDTPYGRPAITAF